MLFRLESKRASSVCEQHSDIFCNEKDRKDDDNIMEGMEGDFPVHHNDQMSTVL